MSKDRTFPAKLTGVGLVVGSLGYVSMDLPMAHADLAGGGGLGAGVVLVGGSITWWASHRRSTDGAISAWSRRSRRTGGVATGRDHRRLTSARALRRRATHLRPSIQDSSWYTRYRMPMNELGVFLGTSGWRRLYASLEDVVLRVAGTRSGKTTAMAARIIDAPGGCVVTSTRVDLLKTLPMRAQRGPCHIYDPAGLTGTGSTVKWSPLSGCRQPGIAQNRGRDMIPEKGSSEGERWDVQGRRILSVLMHAAALSDRPMRTVMRWLSADGEGKARAMTEVDQALTSSPMADPMRLAARQYFTTADRTRSSIVTTAMPALEWLTDARAAQIGDCDLSESIDLADLLDNAGTLYILGSKEGTTAPLTGALVAELVRRAEITAERRGGRLDPVLTLVLDEAAKVAPGPLHQWTADCGGRGILLDIAVQSIAALEETWGPAAARMILGNANAVLVGAGCKDPHDLAHWEKLSGVRYEQEEQLNDKGEVTARIPREVPTIPMAQIAALEKGKAIVYGLGPVTIITTPDTWKRRDVRRSLRTAVGLPQETNYAEDDDLTRDETAEQPAQEVHT